MVHRSDATARAHVTSGVRPGGCRVLLAEDDDDIAESVSGVLTDAGYTVETCRNGQEALARLREDPADLVVLDLMMPVMDGWEFRAIQRADRSIADIPVVVISADGSAKAAAVHAESYVKKPFAAADLVAAVERVLLQRDRRHLAARLEETERLTLLGTIAAGVGHEINNPLSFAMGNLDLSDVIVGEIRSDLNELRDEGGANPAIVSALSDKLDKLAALLQDSRTGADRVRLIVRNLQSLSRRSDDRRSRVDLRKVLDSSIAMVWNQIKSRATLERNYEESVHVAADEARLGQIFLNLLVNASQAIQRPDPTTNVIRIAIRKEAGYGVVDVEDTGVGMSRSMRSRIFEPFFTTKGQGEGTGLGLSICQDIVKDHGGTITVDSELGRGSVFTVFLPLWSDGDTERLSDGPKVISSHRRLRWTGEKKKTIWIVDDDPLVAHAMSRMLTGGYDVLVAKGPLDVLDRIAAGESFDALLCDLMMPEMSGIDLFNRIVAARPDLSRRMVFISGGMYTLEASEFATQPNRLFLEKPFTEPDLHEVIERATNA